MSSAFALAETESSTPQLALTKAAVRSLRIHAFSDGHQDEVLAFLAQRPIHTVFMSGLIRDNGLVSAANRGTLYGCRDRWERLTGVALIGPKTVIEARDEAALEVFASLIPSNLTSHLVRGEQKQIEYILGKYAADGRTPRQVSREFLLEQKAPAPGVAGEPQLRLAYREDLESVLLINAALAFEESGVNPLLQDGQGMLNRTARRVDQGRVWVLVQDGQMIFKADIISETPQTLFIEGVYVQPEERRQGYGLRCMTQLAHNLLSRVQSICLVVNEDNERARAFYQKAGFQIRSCYNTAYFAAA
ncbi:MAG: GNAT family N-acetyltransferase [Acidobacteriota bacterium]|nr:GNAT family N-acetyltransferase [Acidobacteriota bacterium]